MNKIAVLGDGAWGTTLSIVLAKKSIPVTLWGAFAENVNEINRFRENRAYLRGVPLPDGIEVTSDIEAAISDKDLIVLAVPSRFVGATLENILSSNVSINNICIATKGMDFDSRQTMSELVYSFFPEAEVSVLSGPAIAMEVAKEQPTAMVCAGKDASVVKQIQELFSTKYLRIYRSDDVTGVELGGSMKNVIAIAAGVCDGLGFGTNAKSALLTRGIIEMARFICLRGGRKETVYGISGLGDLMTTAFNPLSRNRSFGEAIAKGEDPISILNTSKKAIEGAYTVKLVKELADEHKIDMPISQEVYDIVFKGKPPLSAFESLMLRPLKAEV